MPLLEFRCEFGTEIANSEKDKCCEEKATWKIIDKDGLTFYVCDKHLKELKGIEKWNKIKIS